MAQAFALVTQGTELEGASLEMVVVQARNTCRRCGRMTESDDLLLACPQCGGLDIELAGGDELMLESIELAATPVGTA
jgi:hydrogenase nickel incorporation protein HypA/HybF